MDARTILLICNKGRFQRDILIPVQSVDWDIEEAHDSDKNPYLWQPNPSVEVSCWKSAAFPDLVYTIEGCGFKFSFSKEHAEEIMSFIRDTLKESNGRKI